MKIDPTTILKGIALNNGWPPITTEYRFHPTRRWRFDLAFVSHQVAVEIEGVVYSSQIGRHQRAAGYVKDLEKYGEAAALGWQVLRFAPVQVNKELQWVERIIDTVLKNKGGEHGTSTR